MLKNIVIRRAIGTVGLMVAIAALALYISGILSWWSIVIQIAGFTVSAIGLYWFIRDILRGDNK